MGTKARAVVAVTATLSLLLLNIALVETAAQAGSGTPVFATYAAPASLPNSNNAGEPSVGVNWNTGAVMYQAYTSTYKVAFNDSSIPATATWSNVTPNTSQFNIDPILATDSKTGRTWAGGLAGPCSVMSYTDNDGTAWTQMTNTCSGTVDHETIGAGPWHGAAPLGSTYQHAVYYCAQISQDACSTSSNGGLTFGAPVPVMGACISLHGHVKVSADGTAYLPNNNCGNVGGGITVNNGSNWNSYTIAGQPSAARGFDPSVATTPDNTVYEAWAANGNYHPMVAKSTNHGTSWTGVTDLANTVSPPVVASTFQAATAGDNGRVAVAWLGTQVGSGVPFDNGYHGVWNLFVSFTYDGGTTWQTIQASQDPVQRGCIWDGGGSNVCRNLLDFMDAQVTKDGRVVVAYADGCTGACAGSGGTEAQSTSAYATIARQSTGKGLFAAYDSGPSTPAAPVLTALGGNAQAMLNWTTPNDGGAAITGYNVYRSTASGAETLYRSLGVVNSFTDTGLTNGTTYYYKVAAVNSAGTGALSNEASATPMNVTNQPPTACFTHSESQLTTSVNGDCSSDSDGSVTAWSWNWGDGSAAGSGSTAGHTYATAGTYTVTLTVTDNGGATGTTNQAVTVSSSDPDPSTPNLANGVGTNATSAPTAGSWQYFKIQVPAGATTLRVNLGSSQTCGLLSCNPDLDLYVRNGIKPTTATFDGSSTGSTSTETVTISNPAAAWWYVGVYVYSGTKALNYTITATYS